MATSNLRRFSKLATDPLRSFRFLAEFSSADGSALINDRIKSFSGGFTNISGLAINTQSIGYREGGFNTTLHQIPGMTTFSPVTFQRGTLYGKDEAIAWMRGLFAATTGDGIANADGKGFRLNVDIYVLDHPMTGAPGLTGDTINTNAYKMKFTIHNAWITSLSYSDLNAGDNQILFETMQLVHEGMSVSFTGANGAALPVPGTI